MTRERLQRLAAATVAEAERDLGLGEIGGNNQGRYVWSLTGRKTSGAWCAAAVSAWIRRASEKLGTQPPVPYTAGAKKLGDMISARGEWLEPDEVPLPGDFPVWDRGGWKGHIGVVSYVHRGGGRNRWFISVEGNVGKFPAVVDHFAHKLGERRLIGFARIW